MWRVLTKHHQHYCKAFLPPCPAVNVYLVSERDVVPEDHHLLIKIIVDCVRAVGGDGDALPLGAPVLDPVQSHDGFSLR